MSGASGISRLLGAAAIFQFRSERRYATGFSLAHVYKTNKDEILRKKCSNAVSK